MPEEQWVGSQRQRRSGRYLYLSLVVGSGQIAVLLLLGRQWYCPCGTIRLWQGALDPGQNSQQLSDYYSLLHLAFGVGLYVWLSSIRSRWSLGRLLTYALASSAAWEIFENLPLAIQLFGNNGSGLEYSGDSIINSVSDTVFVALGFLVASRLSTGLAVATMVCSEITTYLMIGDGVVSGILRIAGRPVDII